MAKSLLCRFAAMFKEWIAELFADEDDADGYPGDTCLLCGGTGIIVDWIEVRDWRPGIAPPPTKTCPACNGTSKVQDKP